MTGKIHELQLREQLRFFALWDLQIVLLVCWQSLASNSVSVTCCLASGSNRKTCCARRCRNYFCSFLSPCFSLANCLSLDIVFSRLVLCSLDLTDANAPTLSEPTNGCRGCSAFSFRVIDTHESVTCFEFLCAKGKPDIRCVPSNRQSDRGCIV